MDRRIIIDYLNGQLKQLGEIGEVRTVLTYSPGHKKICCYGHWIQDGLILAHFNLSIGVHKVSYPHFRELTKRESLHGDFIRLQELEPHFGDDIWVAMLGFPIDPDHPRLRFPAIVITERTSWCFLPNKARGDENLVRFYFLSLFFRLKTLVSPGKIETAIITKTIGIIYWSTSGMIRPRK